MDRPGKHKHVVQTRSALPTKLSALASSGAFLTSLRRPGSLNQSGQCSKPPLLRLQLRVASKGVNTHFL